jgi:glutaredoxin
MIKLYTRTSPPCSYCEAAKTLLKVKNVEHEVVVVGEGGSMSKEQLLEMFPNARTFPVVMDGSTYVGGFNELKTYVQNKELGEMSL